MNLPTKQADGSGRFYEYVIDNIRQMIADGELQAGQKLPSERELAEKFNVSRVPIREALKILEYMGVLDSSPGDGTYVKNTSAQSLVSKMDFPSTPRRTPSGICWSCVSCWRPSRPITPPSGAPTRISPPSRSCSGTCGRPRRSTTAPRSRCRTCASSPTLPPGPGQGRPQRRALQRIRVPL